jgi:hypothetical protein
MATPDVLTAEYLASRWPRLYHMAEAGTWDSIQRHGLLSTSALLDLFEIEGPQRHSIESARRDESVQITHPLFGSAWIRDNKRINETVLRRTLVGMTEAEWYRNLNGRVFFWLREKRLRDLRKATAYGNRQHDIGIVDTARLLGEFYDIVELSPINSGAVHPGSKSPRGIGTFRRIEDYDWKDRLRVRPREPIVELTIPYRVPDLSTMIISIETV